MPPGLEFGLTSCNNHMGVYKNEGHFLEVLVAMITLLGAYKKGLKGLSFFEKK